MRKVERTIWPKYAGVGVSNDHTINCSECGWPLPVMHGSITFTGRTRDGDRTYQHARCPSLKQRAALRRAALG